MGFIAEPRAVPGVSLQADQLEQKMGWIHGYEEPLTAWSEMLEVTATSLCYIRQHGYHPDAKQELAAKLAPFLQGKETAASRVAGKLLAFVGEQSSDLHTGQRLLGSSEVLESLIGKAKQLEGQQSKSGFTKMILAAAASVGRLTKETLSAALASVKQRHVLEWIQNNLGTSVQGQRMHAFAAVSAEQNRNNLIPPIL